MRDTIIHMNSAESFRYTFQGGITIQLDTTRLDSQEYFYYSIINESPKLLWLNVGWQTNQSDDTLSLYAFPFWHYYMTHFVRIRPGKILMDGCSILEYPTNSFTLILCFIENYQTLLKETKGAPEEVDLFKSEDGWQVYIPHEKSPGKVNFFISIENFVPTDTSAQVTVSVISN